MTRIVYHEAGDVQSLQFVTPFQFGVYSDESHTGFTVTDGVVGATTDQIFGSGFFYDGRTGAPTGGTVAGMRAFYEGDRAFDISGMNLPAAQLMHDVDSHSRGKIIHDFLGGADQEFGSSQGDALFGYGGDDTLNGRADDDKLIGGAGQDHLKGGAGADTFVFLKLGDSTNAAPDVITDLSNDDTINLKAIDRDLTLVSAFDGHAHELVLTYDARHDRTVLQADVDGDGHADMTVLISGDHHDFTNFAL
jgi:serralysin